MSGQPETPQTNTSGKATVKPRAKKRKTDSNGVSVYFDKSKKRWRVSRSVNGKTKRSSFATKEEADNYADELRKTYWQQGVGFELTDAEKRGILMYRAHQKERLHLGKHAHRFDEAIQDIIEMENEADHNSPLFSEVLDKYSLYMEQKGVTHAHLIKTLAQLHKLAEYYSEDTVSSITVESVKDCLEWIRDTVEGRDGGYPSASTIKAYRTALNSMLNYAAKHGIIDKNPCDLLPPIILEEPERETYTPEELRQILTTLQEHKPGALPVFAIAAFCGVRMQEISRLEWKDIYLEGDTPELKVPHAKSKTGYERFIPIPPVLIEWFNIAIGSGIEQRGFIVSGTTPERREWTLRRYIDLIRKHSGLEWKRNALRHSFACAVIDNLPQVASWLGNAMPVMNRHYRRAKRKAEGEAWFEVVPAQYKQ